MKAKLILVLSVFLAGCVSTPEVDRKSDVGVSGNERVDFDVEGGYVQQEPIDHWSTGEPVCVEILPHALYNDRRWMSVTGVAIDNGDEKNSKSFSLGLLAPSPSKEELWLGIKKVKDNSEVLYKEVLSKNGKLGVVAPVRLIFPEKQQVAIEVYGDTKSYSLDFVPSRMNMYASSIAASLGYTVGECSASTAEPRRPTGMTADDIVQVGAGESIY